MLGQNYKIQNGSDQLQALPNRTWKECCGEKARKAWLGAAMMGAGLGLPGFGGRVFPRFPLALLRLSYLSKLRRMSAGADKIALTARLLPWYPLL